MQQQLPSEKQHGSRKIGFSFLTRDNFSIAHFEFQSITKSPMIDLKSSPENTYRDIYV